MELPRKAGVAAGENESRLRKIGAAASELGLSEHRIREYERAGLIRPRRETSTGDRLFGNAELAQLRILKRLIHEQGFTIQAIRELIRHTPCWVLTNCEWQNTCPVVHNPSVPCYRQRANGVRLSCSTDCQRCIVFGSKENPCSPVVVRPSNPESPKALDGSHEDRLVRSRK